MGTRVQCNSYILGYHPTRDLNEDASFSRSLFCEDRAFIGQPCKDFKPRGGCWLDFSKEMLKQTMLEHEAIFQKQVCELHRLYRIQRELMHEHKKRFSGPLETSNSSMFQSQVPPRHGESMWHLPHLSLDNTRMNPENITVNDVKGVSWNILKEHPRKCCSSSTTREGYIKDVISFDTKLNKVSKRTLDLHLPADAFIENDDTGSTSRETIHGSRGMAAETRNCSAGDVNFLTLSNVEVPAFGNGTLKSNLQSRNGLPVHSLADLNEPFKDSYEGGTLGSGCYKHSGLSGNTEELKQPWNMMRSKSSSHANLLKDKQRDVVILNFLEADKVERAHEWPPQHSDSGQNKIDIKSFSSSLFSDKYPMSSESIKLKLDKARNQTEKLFGERTTQSSEISGSQGFLKSIHGGFAVSQVNSPLSFSYVSPQTNLSKSINSTKIAVQGLSCFSRSALLNEQGKNYCANTKSRSIDCDKVQCQGDLQPWMRTDCETSSLPNGLHHNIQISSLTGSYPTPSNLEKANLSTTDNASPYEKSSTSEMKTCLWDLQFIVNKSANDLNLNQETLGSTESTFPDKHEYDESKCLNWLGEKPSCISSASYDNRLDLGSFKDYSVPHRYLGEQDEDKGSTLCALKRTLASSNIKEERIQASIVTDSLNSDGFLNSSYTSRNSFYSSNHESRCGRSLAYEPGHGNKRKVRGQGSQNDINLNSDFLPTNIPAADVANIPSILPINVVGKLTNIDLEAPANDMEEDNILPVFDTVSMVLQAKPVVRSQEMILAQDSRIKLAADIMLSMLVDVHNHVDTMCDSLDLLAEVALSTTDNAVGKLIGNQFVGSGVSCDDKLDLFESMTLKLQELKADEYCCKQCQQDEPKDDEKSMALLLTKPPRRGQSRKRRQRRDFQKDVLPSLASLSRHEMTQDLQALGGITRTSKSRQTATARSTGQNKSSNQSRGRRQPRSLAIAVDEVNDNSSQMQAIHAELENNVGTIMAWGRTTRRCRRQRIPLGHASAPQE